MGGGGLDESTLSNSGAAAAGDNSSLNSSGRPVSALSGDINPLVYQLPGSQQQQQMFQQVRNRLLFIWSNFFIIFVSLRLFPGRQRRRPRLLGLPSLPPAFHSLRRSGVDLGGLRRGGGGLVPPDVLRRPHGGVPAAAAAAASFGGGLVGQGGANDIGCLSAMKCR